MPQSNLICPHCGKKAKHVLGGLIATHDFDEEGIRVCPGSGQIPRNGDSDKRPLWKDEKRR